MKSRHGICKLALQTGIDIVPGYLFGNSKTLNVWYDKYGIMAYISRKIRASLVLFSGRFLLPIPYRVPLLSVFGDPIKVTKIDNPTPEDINKLLDTLVCKIQELFDLHKGSYGWENVKLVIK